MLKPPHDVARRAYEMALKINPNNHALDGGRASSAMEKEAVAELAHMIGWDTHLGHLCGGGTMANLEALWVAGQLNPGKTVLASTQAHYTHRRIAGVLGLPFETVPCDRGGRMAVPARFAIHLLHIVRAAPRRDQPRVFAAGSSRRRVVGDAAVVSARAGRSIRQTISGGARGRRRAVRQDSRRPALRHRHAAGIGHSGVGAARRSGHRGVGAVATDIRSGGATRLAPRDRVAAGSPDRRRRYAAGPRHDHLPALGVDEARAPRVGGPDLGHSRRGDTSGPRKPLVDVSG